MGNGVPKSTEYYRDLPCLHPIHPTHLSQNDDHFAERVVIVSLDVIHEGGARVSVAADCHPIIDAVRVPTHNVVQFVAHT